MLIGETPETFYEGQVILGEIKDSQGRIKFQLLGKPGCFGFFDKDPGDQRDMYQKNRLMKVRIKEFRDVTSIRLEDATIYKDDE